MQINPRSIYHLIDPTNVRRIMAKRLRLPFLREDNETKNLDIKDYNDFGFLVYKCFVSFVFMLVFYVSV